MRLNMNHIEKRKKTRRIPEIYLEIIKSNLDKVLTREMSTYQLFKLINEKAKIENKKQISDQRVISKAIRNILEDDSERLKRYEEVLKSNIGGNSVKKEKEIKERRQGVEDYQIVSNAEFLQLPEAEQEKQLIAKIRKAKLQEEKKSSNKKMRVLTEETIAAMIQRTEAYFRSKKVFLEQDIRFIIFRCPSIINFASETLDDKIRNFTSYEEIDTKKVFHAIKTFPAIMGYSKERTKEQLDLLQKDHLIDYVMRRPGEFMKSVALMYALIEYAKERHHTRDLTNIVESNIFLTNNHLKRLYDVSYEDIKKRFPYKQEKEQEQDTIYTVTGEDIGRLVCQKEKIPIQNLQEASRNDTATKRRKGRNSF